MLQSCQRCNGFFHFSSSKTAPAFCTEAGAVFLRCARPSRAAPRRAGFGGTQGSKTRVSVSRPKKRIPALWGRKGEPGIAPARTNMETATCPSKSRAVVCSSETDVLRRSHGTDGTQRNTSCKKGKQPRRGEPQRRPTLPGVGGNSTAKREVSPCGRGHGKGRGFAPPAASTRLLTVARRSYFFSPLPARLRATAATPQPIPPTE